MSAPYVEGTIVLAGPGIRKFTRLNNLFATPMAVLEGPVRDMISHFVDEQFNSEGEAGGERWADLADRTAEDRESLGYFGTNPILERSGNLHDALVGGEPQGEVFVQYFVENKTLYIEGSGHGLAAHQASKDPRMPARPIFPDPMPDAFIKKLHSLVSGYAVGFRFHPGSIVEEEE